MIQIFPNMLNPLQLDILANPHPNFACTDVTCGLLETIHQRTCQLDGPKESAKGEKVDAQMHLLEPHLLLAELKPALELVDDGQHLDQVHCSLNAKGFRHQQMAPSPF